MRERYLPDIGHAVYPNLREYRGRRLNRHRGIRMHGAARVQAVPVPAAETQL